MTKNKLKKLTKKFSKKINQFKTKKMKRKLLFTISLFCAAIVVNAQVEPTTYRGAFAPAPVPMWTDSWTNFDPQNAVYGPATITKSGTITASETWTSNNVYKISGLVYIDSLVTLTIQPGTIIRGDETVANSSLIITRGAKIDAQGTVCNPIVFTSNKAIGARGLADWGGVIILGKAKNNQGLNTFIEGISQTNSNNAHGGTGAFEDDNSGILKYVRIEFGGYVFAPNNEINGLTLGSVGSGTTIDYVQCSFINDDAFEWFGGTVNCKHLVAYRSLDDGLDTDYGWSGTVQYGLVVRDPAISDNPAVSTSEGFESDNDPVGTSQGVVPKTSGSFYNVTAIGGYRCASNAAASAVAPTANGFRRGARLRRNTDLKIINSILMNHQIGLFINNNNFTLANMDEDSCRFRNNIIAADFTSSLTLYNGTTAVTATTGLARAAEDQPTRDRLFKPEYGNDSINTCSLLTNAWSFTNPDYRPNPAFAGAVTPTTNITGAADLSAGIDIDNNIFTPNQGLDFVVNVFEGNVGTTAGTITITVAKPSGWTVTVPSVTLSGSNQTGTSGNSDVFGGTANLNSNWNFREDATNVYATSKVGIIIPKGGSAQVGFKITRKAATSTGTNQSVGATLSGGGDITPTNNSAIQGLSTTN